MMEFRLFGRLHGPYGQDWEVLPDGLGLAGAQHWIRARIESLGEPPQVWHCVIRRRQCCGPTPSARFEVTTKGTENAITTITATSL